MSAAFDPYLAWLGIRDHIRPPNHYRLLGLEAFETDPDVIATAADRQMAHVRTFQSGPHAQASQRLLNELSVARLCLLKPAVKTAYDRELQTRLSAAAPPVAAGAAAARPVPVAQRIAAPLDSPSSAAAIAEEIVSASSHIGGGVRRHRPASASGRLVGLAVAIGVAGIVALVAWQSGLFDRLGGDVPRRPGATARRSPTATGGGAESPTKPAATPRVAPGSSKPRGPQPAPAKGRRDDEVEPVRPNRRGQPEPSTGDVTSNGASDTADSAIGPATESDDSFLPADDSMPADDDGNAENPAALPDDMVETPATALPLAPPSEADDRLDPPAADAVRTAMQKVKEVFAAELADESTPEARTAAARVLLERCAEMRDDPAGEFAMLKAAEEKAIAAADAALLADVVAARAKRFRVEPLAEMADGLGRLVKVARAPGALQGVMETSGTLLEQSIAAERFDRAADLARVFGAAARKSKIKSASSQATAHEKRVRDLQKAYERAEQARAQLASKPDDANAHLTLGRYLAFSRAEWTEGLAHLARGSDEVLADLASRDAAVAGDAASALVLADAWWQAPTDNGAVKNGCRARARVWYERALPELTGLEKARVEKRLASREGRLRHSANRTVPVPLAKDASGREVKLTLALVAPGRFLMGSPPSESARQPLEAAHTVTLTRPYYIGTTELTRGQWAAIMGTASAPAAANLPMANINWNDCTQFCQRLNAQLAGTPWASRLRVRPPTEAEWEYACRAGQSTAYCSGDNPASLSEFGWSSENGQSRVHAVAQLRPNAWGLYDMHGNVAEWCADVYAPYPQQAATDPVGPAGGQLRVQRGGSAGEEPLFCRSARRGAAAAGELREFVGFRVAADSLGGN